MNDNTRIPYIRIRSDAAMSCPVCGEHIIGGDQGFSSGMTHLQYDHEMRVLHVSSESDGVKKWSVAVFGPTAHQANMGVFLRAAQKSAFEKDSPDL